MSFYGAFCFDECKRIYHKTTLQNSLPEATTFSKGLSVTRGGDFLISRRQTLIF